MDQLGQILGALGLFAAMMAVLALGTEVMIDTLKFLVGWKRKPTALEAVDKLASKLPGQLADLGVSSKDIARLEGTVASLKGTLATLQRPVDIKLAMQAGDFATAFTLAVNWAQQSGQLPDASWQATVLPELDNALRAVAGRLQLDQATTDRLSQRLNGAAASIRLDQVVDLAPRLYDSVQAAATELAHAWLRPQLDRVVELGREEGRSSVLAAFDQSVAPELGRLGLTAEAQAAIRAEVDKTLAQVGGSLYLDALRELLQGVEDRRYNMQSPTRKLWRRLRRSRFPYLERIKPGWDWISLGNLLVHLEQAWNFFLGRDMVHEGHEVEALTPTNTARRLIEMDNRHKDEESSRLRILRVASVVMGVYMAFLLQVNAVELLREQFPGLAAVNSTVNTVVVLGWLNAPLIFLNRLPLIRLPLLAIHSGMELNAGILLSGLAASAGSAFWHDVLERLQLAKRRVTQVQEVVAAVQGDNNA